MMNYSKDKKGNEISRLGYGCMRFTKKMNIIDFEKAEKEIMHAIENGVNYFDTAYIYPGSEDCLGKILEKNNCRDKVYLATKLPQYIMRSKSAINKTFEEQLSRLRTDYIDYYLMHMFTDVAEWENLKKLEIEQWIEDRKADGRIRNIGFSYHGESDMFIKLLDVYDWDFCLIQYNYLDEHTQAGRKGLMAAAERGIPVFIMEPLRGGKLVNIPSKAKEILNSREKKYTPAELGLRWLWNQPEVACVLSGMNSIEMIDENIRIASDAEPGHFSDEDFETINQVKTIIKEKEKVGCTSCRYCMPCPKGVEIPSIFYYYNLMYMEKKFPSRIEFAQAMALRKNPGFASQCIDCGKCELHCPQHIKIREVLREADKSLRPLPFKIGIEIARKIVIK